MIYDKIENIENYKGIDERLYQALLHIKNNDFSHSVPGGNEIEGQLLYYNFVEDAQTNLFENSSFEAHRVYADIHVDIEGEETVYISDISVMKAQTAYDEDGDYLMMSGPCQVEVKLQPCYFVVCLPNDIHMPMVATNGKVGKIKKAIYKVKLK